MVRLSAILATRTSESRLQSRPASAVLSASCLHPLPPGWEREANDDGRYHAGQRCQAGSTWLNQEDTYAEYQHGYVNRGEETELILLHCQTPSSSLGAGVDIMHETRVSCAHAPPPTPACDRDLVRLPPGGGSSFRFTSLKKASGSFLCPGL